MRNKLNIKGKINTFFIVSLGFLLFVISQRYLGFLDNSDETKNLLFFLLFLSFIFSIIGILQDISKFKKNDQISIIGIIGNSLIFLFFVYQLGKIIFPNTCIICKEIKIEEFDFIPSDIQDNTQVRILSISDQKNCSPDKAYYYSIVAILIETGDTVRILSRCQVLSHNFQIGTFIKSNKEIDALINSHISRTIDRGEYVLINRLIPYQNGDYPAAFGRISFSDPNDEILKEELMKRNIDTCLLDSSNYYQIN